MILKKLSNKHIEEFLYKNKDFFIKNPSILSKLEFPSNISDNEKPSKVIEWKQNRAVFFSRVEKKTWHSYEGNLVSNRLALVYNIMTRNIKGVCKIEKKNYYSSILRYKVNPNLYRFFKFVI